MSDSLQNLQRFLSEFSSRCSKLSNPETNLELKSVDTQLSWEENLRLLGITESWLSVREAISEFHITAEVRGLHQKAS